MGVKHYFEVYIAMKYGVHSALLFQNLWFWIKKNQDNGQNFFDGYYWTYNSKKAFAELFPYMSERQIDYALKKLIDAGLVLTGNYNKVPYDRTLWYAITQKAFRFCKIVKSNQRNWSLELTRRAKQYQIVAKI